MKLIFILRNYSLLVCIILFSCCNSNAVYFQFLYKLELMLKLLIILILLNIILVITEYNNIYISRYKEFYEWRFEGSALCILNNVSVFLFCFIAYIGNRLKIIIILKFYNQCAYCCNLVIFSFLNFSITSFL